MQNILFYLSLPIAALMPSNALASTFVPATGFLEHISTQIHYERSTGRFEYSYKLANSRSSAQSIDLFGVSYAQDDFTSVTTPLGWMSDNTSHELPVLTWFTNEEFDISPGATKTGFRFSTQHAPDIQRYYAQSSFEWKPTSQQDLQEALDSGLLDFDNDSKHGLTVGPGALPAKDPLDEVTVILGLQNRCVSLGWISNEREITDLYHDLAEAKSYLQDRRVDLARVQILRYSRDLVSHRRKAAQSDAVTLLHAHTEYLMSLLGCRPNDDNFRDDDES